jgi:hypothetical protein
MIVGTIAALQQLHATIPGVTSAPEEWPASIATPNLPLVQTWPQEGQWQSEARDLDRQRRRYAVQVLVAPVAQRNADTLRTCIALLDAFGRAYLNPSNNQLANGAELVVEEVPVLDSGIQELELAGKSYLGFEIIITIDEEVE